MTMKVTLSINKLKKLTNQLFRRKRFRCLCMTTLAFIIAFAPGYIVSTLFQNPVVSYILNLYTLVVACPLLLGLSGYFIGQFRDDDDCAGRFPEGFSHFGKALNLFVLTMGITILWSFLFVVPGVIAAIRYSQSFYVLADNPDMSPLACMAESKRMMEGNKAKFFVLQLSFIPLYIILMLPSSVVMSSKLNLTGIFDISQYIMAIDQAASDPVVIGLQILLVFVIARTMAANACFYDIVSGNLRLEFDGQIPDFEGKSQVDRYEISGFEKGTSQGPSDYGK